MPKFMNKNKKHVKDQDCMSTPKSTNPTFTWGWGGVGEIINFRKHQFKEDTMKQLNKLKENGI